ncbi:hypothetical protein [Stenotrophobium rhamnosiphilum]|uniref:hypothetical protein n=1 Tax=Stenotrophobium rhamnosiphilum TaxID=2029166 RepID=UPI0011B24211|nr:hypothetical protein [Stenotrophobium rhamnosiphilum]
MNHRTNAHLERQKQQSIVYLGLSVAVLILMFLSQERMLTLLSALLFGITSVRGIVILAGILLDRPPTPSAVPGAITEDIPLRVEADN